MRHAHQIARQARPHMGKYREALAYGLKAAWGLVAVLRAAESPFTIARAAAASQADCFR
jgi:hypothetical protein